MKDMSEWISIKNSGNPMKSGAYLCATLIPQSGGKYYRDYIVLNFGSVTGWQCAEEIVTHWMPLPELPEELF